MWRIVLDSRIPDGLADLRNSWVLDDVAHAIDLLDQLDAREAARASLRER